MASLTEQFADLKVSCPNDEIGCKWKGQLKDVNGHSERCEKDLMRKALGKMKDFETELRNKDREISYLKNNFEIKTRNMYKNMSEDKMNNFYREKSNEIEDLKAKVHELVQEIKDVKESSSSEIAELKQEVQMYKSQVSSGAAMVKQLDNVGKGPQPDLSKSKSDQSKAIGIEKQLSPKKLPTPSKVYFDLGTEVGEHIGRIFINLFFDKAPLACAKFVKLCTHEMGVGYKDRLLGADNTWLGGPSSLKVNFPSELITPHENKGADHDRKGLVTMIQRQGKVEAQFYTLFGPFRACNDQHVMIGELTADTLNVLEKIKEIKAIKGHKVKITACGVVPTD